MGLAVSWAGRLATGSRRISLFAMPASGMMAHSLAATFVWDRRRGAYLCPNNKVLHTTGMVHDGQMLRYLPSSFEVLPCRWASNVLSHGLVAVADWQGFRNNNRQRLGVRCAHPNPHAATRKSLNQMQSL